MESIPSAIKQGFSKINETTIDTSGVIDGYNMLLIITTVFFLLCSILAVYNPDGFDKTLGSGLFITLIMILIAVYILKRFTKFNPTAGQSIQYVNLFQYIKDYSTTLYNGLVMTFGKWETITIGIVLISLFIGLLASFGMLTNNIPSNNSPMLFNYFLILFVTGISVFLFTKARSTVDPVSTIINKTPVGKQAYEDKLKYTGIFILFIIGIIGLYIWNPYGIMSNYGGAGALFFLIFIGMALFSMIKLNDYFFNNPDKQAEYNEIPGIFSFFKVIYVFFALIVSGLLLWGFLSVIGMFNNSGTSHGIGHTIINLILLMSMLGILYKLVNAGGFLERNPYFRLVLNTVLYIPCLLVVVTDYLSKIFFGTNVDINGINGINSKGLRQTKNDFAFLIIAVFACALYIFMTTMAVPIVKQQVYNVGGQTLVTTPIPIGQKSNLSSFSTLNGVPGLSYTYAISFWFYIDSFPPSMNNAYTKSVSIMSYGDQLHVKYYSPTNTLYVTVKEDPDNVNDANIGEVHDLEKTITADNIALWESIKESIMQKINEIKEYKGQYELDESNDRIVYKKTNVLLQKWNNIVLNYSSGTLDVFLNGELVKTAINVINHNTQGASINDILSVGTEKGISGSVSNLTYYKTPIDLLTINKLYELFKDNNPPIG